MKHTLLRSMALSLLLALPGALAYGQASATAALSGTVLDASGAVIPGADLVVKNSATGAEFKAMTADNGTFTVPALAAGTYEVTVTVPGFKQAVVKDVKLDAGIPASVNVKLEVGQQTDTITVTGGGEVLQTQSATVATTITGRQITELPFTSRDALDLVLLLPGTATPGRPRTSSVNGLPKGALNISLDGVNVQDNLLKSSDGFFTYIRPRIDAIDEVTLSTATPGAESASEGAVQIKFVTRSGNNEYHGSLYEYHRNPALNANYWFNNRDLPADPKTGKAPRDRVLLNQYGFRAGGPIGIPGIWSGKDRAFFFVNYEEYRLPEQTSRNRTILNERTQTGIFRYNSSTGVREVNLLSLAAANNQTSTIDPTVSKLLADIRAATKTTGGVTALTDPNLENFFFTNTGGQARFFPTIRFDFNLTNKHHLENIYNYQKFDSTVDFLNGVDPAFPGFPNHGSQVSNRFSNVIALRSTLSPTLVNEARIGLTGGTVLFFPEVNAGQFANQSGFTLGLGAAGISGATVTTFTGRRNTPVWQYSDTLTWTRGTHGWNFGWNFTQVNYFGSNSNGGVVPSIGFGIDTTDPAAAMFVAANFPGASAADITRAQGIYATLVGRVTSIGATAYVDETGKYQYLGPFIERARQREMGMFVSDSWRWRSNLTLNYGLRWEVQFPFTALNKSYAKTSFEELYGISGAGNLFKPGTLTGKETQFTLFKPGEDKAFSTDYLNFAPSFGIAWSPNAKGGFLGRLFGEGGRSVIRAGYSIAFNREGMNVVSSILGANPGGSVTATRSIALGNLTAGTLLRSGSLGPPTIPSGPVYPLTGAITNSANAFDPDLRLGYIQSWTLGIQRELNRDTVIEARYVANHGTGLWRQYNLNEVNTVDNKFFDEFKLAQANLAANIAAGRGNSFAYFGPGTGTAPLPITLAYFSGISAANSGVVSNYTSTLFTNATFVNALAPDASSVQGFASNLYAVPARRTNAATAGLPANQFVVNPGKLGGAFIIDNGGSTSYNALVFELRRRMSKGLLMQGSYAFSKGMTNMYASSSVVFSGYFSLRQTNLNRTISPWNVTHAFKLNWIYELPIGRGRALFGNAGGVGDRIFGGWEFHGTARLQSGSPFNFGNVNLVGMTREELQDAVKIRHDDAARISYFLPDDIIQNTRRAFNVTTTGFSSLGAPTGRYIAPASNRSCVQAYAGQCGFSTVILYGPRFTRFDLSAVKKIRISETVNFELRGEFLNAFNNINFRVGSPASDVVNVGGFASATFGQTRSAYQDISTTNDPGGRLIQFVARINF